MALRWKGIYVTLHFESDAPHSSYDYYGEETRDSDNSNYELTGATVVLPTNTTATMREDMERDKDNLVDFAGKKQLLEGEGKQVNVSLTDHQYLKSQSDNHATIIKAKVGHSFR